jgi:hypothetical protein
MTSYFVRKVAKEPDSNWEIRQYIVQDIRLRTVYKRKSNYFQHQEVQIEGKGRH